MNLQRTIAELEEKAAQYSHAAQALGVLLPYEETASASFGASAGQQKTSVKQGPNTPSAAGKSNASSKAGSKGGSNNRAKRPPMSAEARAELSAIMKARHQQKIGAAG